MQSEYTSQMNYINETKSRKKRRSCAFMSKNGQPSQGSHMNKIKRYLSAMLVKQGQMCSKTNKNLESEGLIIQLYIVVSCTITLSWLQKCNCAASNYVYSK